MASNYYRVTLDLRPSPDLKEKLESLGWKCRPPLAWKEFDSDCQAKGAMDSLDLIKFALNEKGILVLRERIALVFHDKGVNDVVHSKTQAR